MKTTQTMPVVEAAIIVPTPCGLPLALNMSGIVVTGVETAVTVENLPSLRDVLSLVGPRSTRFISMNTL